LVNVTLRPLYHRERNPVLILEEAVLASGPVWMGPENLTPVEFDLQTV
jgi:hypothetical protein